MYAREITYEDFNGNTRTERFYFNLTHPELIELDVDYKGGMAEFIEKVSEAKDHKELIALFKRIVLLAYGEKSEDGRHFVKSEDIRNDFSHHAAYPVMYMGLATDSDLAVEFLRNTMPKDIVNNPEFEKAAADMKAEAEKTVAPDPVQGLSVVPDAPTPPQS